MSELIGKSSEGTYQGKPMRTFEGKFRMGHDGREYEIQTNIVTHPNLSRRIIVNLPGRRGDIDGFEDKYVKLSHHIQSTGLAAVVRTGNDFEGYPGDINLRAALTYTREHAWEICGEPNPEVFLMGFSAGAAAIAARAHEYPEVTRILLGAPATGLPGANVRQGMEKFTGETYIMIGDHDENVGTDSGQIIYDWAKNASHRELFLIPDCDHQFRGETNGRIMSEAPFYAFGTGEKPVFPDPAGGIKLYD